MMLQERCISPDFYLELSIPVYRYIPSNLLFQFLLHRHLMLLLQDIRILV